MVDYRNINFTQERKSYKRSHGVNAGSVSVIMIFTVLCLAVFAILTMVSANAELRLAQKYSNSVTKYYAADNIVSQFVAEIKNAPSLSVAESIARKYGASTNFYDDGLYITYVAEADERSRITVEMTVTETGDTITAYYQFTESGFVMEFSFGIWMGE
ncbi:MAG: hypothetical protein FWF15_00305 [Oscillospiraceae bacterium]|nr:hypothetical protein [Oscillospiraceae bacterium]